MDIQNLVKNIEGYDTLATERAVLQRYGRDFRRLRGAVAEAVNRLHPARLRLRVSEIRDETPSTRTVRLTAVNGVLPPFVAGQYVNVFGTVGGVATSRPYSISSPPTRIGYYDLTVRRMADGFFSNWLLDKVSVGAVLETTGPAGHFHHNPLFHGEDLVFLAGGSGITPFMSMIREITDRGLDRRVHLLYGSRKVSDIIFREELEDRARRHPNITVHHVISEPEPGWTGPAGFLTARLIADLAGNAAGRMFYVCGPEAMYGHCLTELEVLGVPRRRIRTEVFGPPQDITRSPGWPEGTPGDKVFTVRVEGAREIRVMAGEPLLTGLERAGLAVPTSCRSGECSLCRVRLVSGTVFQGPGARLRKSDRQFGFIHACAAYPIGDLVIRL